MTQFFKLFADQEGPWWLLGEPAYEPGPRRPGQPRPSFQLGKAQPVAVDGLYVSVLAPGEPAQVSWTVTLLPVVTTAVMDLIEEVTPGAVQWIPVAVEGESEPRFHANILHLVDCIDPERTRGIRFPEDDERAGHWQLIHEFYVKPDVDPPFDIFQVEGYMVRMVVTRRLKEALEGAGVTGASYDPLRT